jgi:peptide/nickel transport system permease protein
MVGGVAVGMLIALPAGYISARRRGKATDHGITAFTTIMLSIPQFVLGLVLLIAATAVPAVGLTTSGWVDPTTSGYGPWLHSMGLPWLTLGLSMSAFTSRVFRATLIEESHLDYVRTARATGLSGNGVWRKHIVKNASVPTITVVGLEVGYLLGGSIIIEKVFTIPGLGQYIVDSISNRDYPAVQAAVLTFAAAFIVINLIVDTAYTVIDPRIRTGGAT